MTEKKLKNVLLIWDDGSTTSLSDLKFNIFDLEWQINIKKRKD